MAGREEVKYCDEVILTYVWAALRQYRVLVVIIFLASLLAGGALIYVLPTKYEAVARIKIGRVGGEALFEDPGTLRSQILTEHGINGVSRRMPSGPYVRAVQVARGTTDIIEITAISRTREEGVKLLEDIYASIHRRHDQYFNASMSIIKSSLAAMEWHQAQLHRTYQQLAEVINEKLDGNSAEEYGLLLMMHQGQVNQVLTELNAKMQSLANSILPPNSVPTSLIGGIVAGEDPVVSSPNW